MEKNKKIVIFTEDHKIGVILELKNGTIIPNFKDPNTETKINDLLKTLETKNPSIKVGSSDDTGNSIGFEEILPDNKKYPVAVLEEINRRGMTAAFASDVLLKLLEWVTENMPKEELEKELGNFLVMSDDDAKVFLDGIGEIYRVASERV